MNDNSIRSLYSRAHTTIFPKLGVFLAGPTPFEGESMLHGWRRKVISQLQADERLNASMTVVAPEPASGYWADIDLEENNELNQVLNKQIPWEWQYLQLCDITAFWLPSYWQEEQAAPFSANIGPTSRLEFGYFLQEYLKNPAKRSFIVGAPEDAESIKWAKRITDMHGIEWHILPKAEKEKQVADSFTEAIAQQLIAGNWQY